MYLHESKCQFYVLAFNIQCLIPVWWSFCPLQTLRAVIPTHSLTIFSALGLDGCNIDHRMVWFVTPDRIWNQKGMAVGHKMRYQKIESQGDEFCESTWSIQLSRVLVSCTPGSRHVKYLFLDGPGRCDARNNSTLIYFFVALSSSLY